MYDSNAHLWLYSPFIIINKLKPGYSTAALFELDKNTGKLEGCTRLSRSAFNVGIIPPRALLHSSGTSVYRRGRAYDTKLRVQSTDHWNSPPEIQTRGSLAVVWPSQHSRSESNSSTWVPA